MMNAESHRNIWSSLLILLTGSMLSNNAQAAVTTEPHLVPASVPHNLLYKVSCDGLEDLKESLVQINLHMRENAGKLKPFIRLSISGGGVQWLQENKTDPELQNMLEWFHDENVQVGVNKSWMDRLNIQPEDLHSGLVIMHLQPSTPKED